jgi:hypothetical protein
MAKRRRRAIASLVHVRIAKVTGDHVAGLISVSVKSSPLNSNGAFIALASA